MDSTVSTKVWRTGGVNSTATPCPILPLSKSGHMKLHTVPELTCFLTGHSKTVCPQLFCWPTPILPLGRPQLVLLPYSLSKLNRKAGYPPLLLPQHPGGIPTLALSLHPTVTAPPGSLKSGVVTYSPEGAYSPDEAFRRCLINIC